jgi:hypothetical protein
MSGFVLGSGTIGIAVCFAAEHLCSNYLLCTACQTASAIGVREAVSIRAKCKNQATAIVKSENKNIIEAHEAGRLKRT